MRTIACIAVLVALIAAAGARDLPPASAPAPAMSKPIADLVFTLSAEKASFPTSTTLQLQGVSSTAQYYGAGAKAGLISTSVFTNGSAGAEYVASNGEWLNVPDAVLFATSGSSNKAILISLQDPIYNKEDKTVTFNIAVLPADEAALKTARGVTNELVMEHANNVGTPLTEAVQPSAVWNDVALFIDQNRESLKPIAETKWGSGSGWGGSGWGGSGWGSGSGSRGWNSGWGSNYGWGK
ncbi:hypothetical protein COCSUDRAFT_53613 [Coccomyxa subellipsoidea C-169]|uniref:Calx-beta domain-containing protein n=1 Tax=Coccomyxa subellipsoidea (strain C-169) TaxID=574566 RepID=I0YW62_COCSC|nr:hypothetical protein COCSUDRAFT_53613 [Coccomyxa subellipsoidea C-169]EIE22631.1 hypothetical protein COCSUDRAFT_53613 [Coccomyxa subellipsoidea C-169]|eukprot:XP_005647175.1 hypothetical protein COCSUDRAFT_53613 [Coccomyxa subellipsoidea C-169]